MADMAQTVLGPIRGADLGFTLPHEHIVFDGSSIFAEPAASSEKQRALAPLDWDILSWLRYHPYENINNVRMLDEREGIDEVSLFKAAGGCTMVDVTIPGIGRDPKALARISRLTGVNIVMGTGLYTEPSLTQQQKDMSIDDIVALFVRDIREGADGTGIRAGIIGEVACNYPATEIELKAVRAAAIAQ